MLWLRGNAVYVKKPTPIMLVILFCAFLYLFSRSWAWLRGMVGCYLKKICHHSSFAKLVSTSWVASAGKADNKNYNYDQNSSGHFTFTSLFYSIASWACHHRKRIVAVDKILDMFTCQFWQLVTQSPCFLMKHPLISRWHSLGVGSKMFQDDKGHYN